MAHDDVLAQTEFFADASREELLSVLETSTEHELVRGDVLFHEGDEPDALYVVLTGRIAVAIANPIDNRETMVGLMTPGDLFGEMAMLDHGARSANARALETSKVLAIPYAGVLTMFNGNPALLWGVTRLLAGRLRETNEALADSVFLDVTGRTAKRLIELADGRDSFLLPVTQEELAGMVGASRERVNKAIASFIRLGWIDQHDRRYTIKMRDRLELRSR
ncbi:MAG: putative Crp family transcriptional regulator [Acidimicrobiales bacterium]|nr:putative Crp family transcriptional regulator [Acidimicrobiales bacterium]